MPLVSVSLVSTQGSDHPPAIEYRPTRRPKCFSKGVGVNRRMAPPLLIAAGRGAEAGRVTRIMRLSLLDLMLLATLVAEPVIDKRCEAIHSAVRDLRRFAARRCLADKSPSGSGRRRRPGKKTAGAGAEGCHDERMQWIQWMRLGRGGRARDNIQATRRRLDPRERRSKCGGRRRQDRPVTSVHVHLLPDLPFPATHHGSRNDRSADDWAGAAAVCSSADPCLLPCRCSASVPGAVKGKRRGHHLPHPQPARSKERNQSADAGRARRGRRKGKL